MFASETCAFDLVGATYVGEVLPGEMVIAGPDGLTREMYTPAENRRTACLSMFTFRVPIRSFSEDRRGITGKNGALLARQQPVDADVVVPVPDSGVAAAIGYASESGIPLPAGSDSQSLCGPHLH